MFNSVIKKLYVNEKNLLNEVFSNFENFEKEVETFWESPLELLHRTKDGEYQLKVNVAGYKKHEINVSVENSTITVLANNKTFGTAKYVADLKTTELDVNSGKAKLENGILYITFKLRKESTDKKTIDIE